jgi:hypothetical protein
MKTKLFGFAAVAGLFLIGSLMRSPQSQANGAVYSTPVSIVNTTASPGSVLDANTATQVPYQATAACAGSPCVVNFSLVPLGFRLVVEYVGGNAFTSNTDTFDQGYLSATAAFGGPAGWSTIVPASHNGPGNATFGQPVRAYIDPGTPTFTVLAVSAASTTAQMFLTGYLQNCSVSPCPAQQH